MTDYDDYNRRTMVTDPHDQKTEWEYDAAGNVIRETRPDNQSVLFVEYDAMNRLKERVDERQFHTYMTYDHAGNLREKKDERNQIYSYDFDALNRKTRMTYPPNEAGVRRYEDFLYDVAGRLFQYTNRNGKTQTFVYDVRNRQTEFSWNDGITPWQHTDYDAASRVEEIRNNVSTIKFTYRADNLLETEEEWTTTLNDGTRRTVAYTYDNDGNLEKVQYPGGASFLYGYTGRGQLKNITSTGSSTPIVSYSYDRSGNIVGVERANGANTVRVPDDLNRIASISHNFPGNPKQFDYAYNSVNNVAAVRRDLGAGEGFDYDNSRQIAGFKHDAQFTTWPPPSYNEIVNPPNEIRLGFDGCGNRTFLSNTDPSRTGFTYSVNNLNHTPA